MTPLERQRKNSMPLLEGWNYVALGNYIAFMWSPHILSPKQVLRKKLGWEITDLVKAMKRQELIQISSGSLVLPSPKNSKQNDCLI